MKQFSLALLVVMGFSVSSNAQNDTIRNKKGGGYIFTKVKDIEATSVKDQSQTGTCWDFSTTSFFESELIRNGKGNMDLSEMFTVWHTYSDKAEKYVRMHGNLTFGPGGEAHDVRAVLEKYGAVPNAVYNGLQDGEKKYNHDELDKVLKAFLDAVISAPAGKLSPEWHTAFDNILNAYLGPLPTTFEYQGKSYTPQSYAKSLDLHPEDYLELTSFTHHPFYTQFPLEVQDNWAWDEDYNVPLADLMSIIDNAINNGYTVAWGADVSNLGFSYKNGLAIVPDKDWSDFTSKKEVDSLFLHPVQQMTITQDMRQKDFDNYVTQDDHGMQIVGIYTAQDGTKYYKIKNSWGTKGDLGGYFFASAAYVELNTTDIMVDKASIPKEIAKKMGVK
ncbi:MAG TPA: C1 family peptidase [Bacteroidia bacterium]|nr:C1 family peptidase [Bacteroidia bacterium]